MGLSVGERFGPYEVVGALGAGGMGQVYRARDSRLGRDVALKILSDLVARDPERIARFDREARALASLSHPNIAGIHGLEDSGGIQALVLELVEGPTLADRLASGPMPIDDALAVARQIADALEAAHDVGIVHRDLKPANIKLRPDGTVKVLDFGLAKAFVSARDGDRGDSPVHLSHSPTITGPIGATGVGVLLGTAAYMPPEQARGKPVDKRADIWAFGCVLFEMLSGKRCFDGEDVSLILAEVIKAEPDWKALPAGVSAAVRATLKQCLQKDPKLRARDIGDVRLAIDGGFGLATAHRHDRPSAAKPARIAIAIGGAAGIVLGVIATAAMLWRPASAPPTAPLTRFTVALPPGSSFRDGINFPLAVTRDGRRIVVNVSSGGKNQVFVRDTDQITPRLVPGLEDVGSILLSPDGESVAYLDSRNSLRRIRLTGGPAQVIAEIRAPWAGGDWGSAGAIVYATRSAGGLMEVLNEGEQPHPRTTPPEGERHIEPHFLPDGRSLLFTVIKLGEPRKIGYLQAGRKDYVPLIEGTDARYVSSGHLVFTRDRAIWAIRFDAALGRTLGAPVRVLDDVSSASDTGVVRASVSPEGTLVYVVGAPGALSTVVRVDRQGGEEPLPNLAPNTFSMIRVSSDGARLAFVAGIPPDLWTYEFSRGTYVRVTNDDAIERTPLWTPDSSRLVFAAEPATAPPDLYVHNADGTGPTERFLSRTIPAARVDPESWSGDGKTLVVSVLRSGRPDIAAVDLDGEQQLRDLIATPSVDVSATVSPDGRWLAYQSESSNNFEVYMERFPELGDRQRISTTGGTSPRWSSKGDELFYQSIDGRQVFAVPISSGTPGKPKRLFEGSFMPASPNSRPFDVTPDGRFILIKSPNVDRNASATVVVVQNWFEELKRLVP